MEPLEVGVAAGDDSGHLVAASGLDDMDGVELQDRTGSVGSVDDTSCDASSHRVIESWGYRVTESALRGRTHHILGGAVLNHAGVRHLEQQPVRRPPHAVAGTCPAESAEGPPTVLDLSGQQGRRGGADGGHAHRTGVCEKQQTGNETLGPPPNPTRTVRRFGDLCCSVRPPATRPGSPSRCLSPRRRPRLRALRCRSTAFPGDAPSRTPPPPAPPPTAPRWSPASRPPGHRPPGPGLRPGQSWTESASGGPETVPPWHRLAGTRGFTRQFASTP